MICDFSAAWNGKIWAYFLGWFYLSAATSTFWGFLTTGPEDARFFYDFTWAFNAVIDARGCHPNTQWKLTQSILCAYSHWPSVCCLHPFPVLRSSNKNLLLKQGQMLLLQQMKLSAWMKLLTIRELLKMTQIGLETTILIVTMSWRLDINLP